MLKDELKLNNRSGSKQFNDFTTLDQTVENVSAPDKQLDSSSEIQAFYGSRKDDLVYRQILSCERSPDKLIERFAQETTVLRKSDAVGQNFSFKDSLTRMIRGYNMILFDYMTATPLKVFVSADGYGIFLKKPRVLERKIPYHKFSGLLLGGMSSTFSQFERAGGSLRLLGLEPTDCFSVIGNIMSLDFATHSDTAKYDFALVVGHYISSTTPHTSPVIMLNKKEMTLYKMKVKIQAMARERFLFVKELFLVMIIQLAVLKTLMMTGASHKKVSILKKMIEKSVHSGTKLYRMSTLMRNRNIAKSKFFNSKFDESTRILILNRRMARSLLDKVPDQFKFTRAESNISSLLSVKKLLKKKKMLYLN